MPSPAPKLTVPNTIGPRRTELGLAQAELAARCGVSRPFLSMVESGRTQPNVEIALRLARELGCSVEDLFSTDHAAAERALPVTLIGELAAEGARVDLARVGECWIAHVSDSAMAVGGGFAPADAVLVRSGRKVAARHHRPERELAKNVAVAGCDPALALFCREADEPKAGGRAFWVNCGSARALKLLKQGRVHAAGLHYSGSDPNENLRHVHRHDPEGNWALLRFTRWESGWILGPRAVERFKGVADLADKSIRLVNREAGSGSRQWLDMQLARAGLKPAVIRGFAEERASHWDCARAIVEGRGDVAVGPRAIAAAFGLGFLPADEVAFDLAIPKAYLGHPRLQMLLQKLHSQRFRRDVGMLVGYRADNAGSRIAG